MPLLFIAALLTPATTAATVTIVNGEHQIVELATSLVLFLATVSFALLAFRVRRRREPAHVVWFFALCTAAALFVWLEEVAWGQHIIAYETPALFQHYNAQGEVTLHNIWGLHGRTEYMRFGAGVCGLIGMWVARWSVWRGVAVPRTLLWWFVGIALLGGFDLVFDYVHGPAVLHFLADSMSEVVEMMVAIALLLYALHHVQRRR